METLFVCSALRRRETLGAMYGRQAGTGAVRHVEFWNEPYLAMNCLDGGLGEDSFYSDAEAWPRLADFAMRSVQDTARHGPLIKRLRPAAAVYLNGCNEFESGWYAGRQNRPLMPWQDLPGRTHLNCAPTTADCRIMRSES